MSRHLTAVLVALLGMAGMGKARADSILVAVGATGTGSLGSHNFVNAPFTIFALSSTDVVVNPVLDPAGTPHPELFALPSFAAVVQVGGIGTARFDSASLNFVNQSTFTAGFTALSTRSIPLPPLPFDVLNVTSVFFADYTFTPTDLVFGTASINPGVRFPTIFGDFVLRSVDPSSGRFQAVVRSGSITLPEVGLLIPEPSSLSLFGLSALGVAWYSRRRVERRKAPTAC